MNCAPEDLAIGQEIAPVRYVITRESIATYSRYVFDGRDTKNIHTDDEAARRAGLPRAVAQGRYPIGYMSEYALAFFGAGWVQGGRIDVSLIKPIYPGDSITVRAIVSDCRRAVDGTLITLDVWLENQHGERVTVGSASGWMRTEIQPTLNSPSLSSNAASRLHETQPQLNLHAGHNR